MFTGIVEAQGTVQRIEQFSGDRRCTIIDVEGYLDAVGIGESIAVSGICLTAAGLVKHGVVVDISSETLSLTTASRWKEGQRVNLEKPATPAKPLGGHLVSGHVDGLAKLRECQENARSWRLTLEAPPILLRYIARKGSVTLDGVSLTVNEVDGCCFGVNIIPQTRELTTLGLLKLHDVVNLEVDQVARYLERLLESRDWMVAR